MGLFELLGCRRVRIHYPSFQFSNEFFIITHGKKRSSLERGATSQHISSVALAIVPLVRQRWRGLGLGASLEDSLCCFQAIRPCAPGHGLDSRG